MALDPSIILAGRSFNAVNSLAQGAQAAGMQNDVMRQNRLAQLFNEQGPGIMAGDPNALSAYARMDPTAALGVRQTHQSMAESSERLKMAREQARIAAADRVKGIEAEQAAAEAAGLERAIAAALQAQSQEQLDGFLGQTAPELVGKITMENRELYAAQALGVKDALEMSASDPSKRYKVAGNTIFDLEAEGGPQAVASGQGNRQVIRDPATGNVIYETGPVDNVPSLTVDAGKNTGYYIRTKDAHTILNELENQGLDFFQQNAEAIPLGLGNYARTPEFQKFDQARRDFVNAILRRESGAVISDSEFDNANKQYFPQPGDSPEVIAQKRRNRENAIEGLRIGSGEGGAYVDQRAAPPSAPQTFEQFASDPSAQAAAKKYGVTLDEMWAIQQETAR